MSDPDRLLRGDDASERALLESLRADAPSDEQSAGMWKLIAAQAAVATVATTTTAAAAAPAKVGVAKLAAGMVPKALAAKLAVVVAVSAVGAGAALMHDSPPPRAPVAKVQPAVPALAAEQEAARAAERLVAQARDQAPLCSEGVATGCSVVGSEVAAQPAVVEAARPVKRRVAKPALEAATAVPLDSLQAESRLLATARAQLRARDLNGAEQTLNQAREQFAHGSLGQEREVLQIELLAAMGDHDGAEHRARRFLRKHPDSPHAKTVQRFLQAP